MGDLPLRSPPVGWRLGQAYEDANTVPTWVIDEVICERRFPVVGRPDVACLVYHHSRDSHQRFEAGRLSGSVERFAIGEQYLFPSGRQSITGIWRDWVARAQSRRLRCRVAAGEFGYAGMAEIAGRLRTEVGYPDIIVAIHRSAPWRVDSSSVATPQSVPLAVHQVNA